MSSDESHPRPFADSARDSPVRGPRKPNPVTVAARLSGEEWLRLRDYAAEQGMKTGQLATQVLKQFVEEKC